jgi:hypothetical protein
MQCCLKQPNRWCMVNKISLPKSGEHWEDPHFKFFRDLKVCRQSIETITFSHLFSKSARFPLRKTLDVQIIDFSFGFQVLKLLKIN